LVDGDLAKLGHIERDRDELEAVRRASRDLDQDRAGVRTGVAALAHGRCRARTPGPHRARPLR